MFNANFAQAMLHISMFCYLSGLVQCASLPEVTFLLNRRFYVLQRKLSGEGLESSFKETSESQRTKISLESYIIENTEE